MKSNDSTEPTSPADDVSSSSYTEDYLYQLRADATGLLLIFTCIAGVGLVLFGCAAFPIPWQGALVGLVLTLIPILVGILWRERHMVGLCVITATWTVTLFACVLLLPHLPMSYLLVFPVLLATLLTGWRAGMATALGIYLALGAASRLSPGLLPPSAYFVQGLLMVGTWFACWLYSHLARNIIHWYWLNYDEGRRQLEQSRA